MPALVREAGPQGLVTLEARRWEQHDNRSLISPTALAFLILVLVVCFFMPFLCVFCIRKRRRDQPVRRQGPLKAPALQRSEARERLETVTEVSNVARCDEKTPCIGTLEDQSYLDSVSTLEKDCAICLSTLHAPSPPEPVKLADKDGVINQAATALPDLANQQEEILKLKECGHEFHSECVISWVVLHKKSCPICRTVYYHEEPEKPTDLELQTQASVREEHAPVEPASNPEPSASNWHYFWTGRDARQQHIQPGIMSSWQRFRRFRS